MFTFMFITLVYLIKNRFYRAPRVSKDEDDEKNELLQNSNKKLSLFKSDREEWRKFRLKKIMDKENSWINHTFYREEKRCTWREQKAKDKLEVKKFRAERSEKELARSVFRNQWILYDETVLRRNMGEDVSLCDVEKKRFSNQIGILRGKRNNPLSGFHRSSDSVPMRRNSLRKRTYKGGAVEGPGFRFREVFNPIEELNKDYQIIVSENDRSYSNTAETPQDELTQLTYTSKNIDEPSNDRKISKKKEIISDDENNNEEDEESSSIHEIPKKKVSIVEIISDEENEKDEESNIKCCKKIL